MKPFENETTTDESMTSQDGVLPRDQDGGGGEMVGEQENPGCMGGRSKIFLVTLVSFCVAILVVLMIILTRVESPQTTTPIDPPCVDTIVVGGGLTGAYTAWKLRTMQQSVHLYEATDRVGGRLYTYTTDDGIQLELGEEGYDIASNRSVTLASYIEHWDTVVTASPYQALLEEIRLYQRGEWVTANRSALTDSGYSIPADVLDNAEDVHGVLRYLFDQWIYDPSPSTNITDLADDNSTEAQTTAPPVHVGNTTAYSSTTATPQYTNVPDEEIELLRNEMGDLLRDQRVRDVLYDVGDPETILYLYDTMTQPYLHGDVSAEQFYWLLQSHDIDFDQWKDRNTSYVPTRGMASIAQQFLNQFILVSTRHESFKNRRVHRVEYDEENKNLKVTLVHTKSDSTGTTTDTVDFQDTCANSVIFATPPGSVEEVLGHYRMKGMHDVTISRFLDENLVSFPSMKLMILYSYPWWRDDGLTGEAKRIILPSSHPIRELLDGGSYAQGNDTVHVLQVRLNVLFFREYWTRLLSGAPCTVCVPGRYTASQRLYSRVMTHLDAIGGARMLTLNCTVLAVYFHRWTNDRYGSHRYAWKSGSDWSSVYETLMKPTEYNIYLTGFAYMGTSDQQLPIEGTLQSVEKLIERYGEELASNNWEYSR